MLVWSASWCYFSHLQHPWAVFHLKKPTVRLCGVPSIPQDTPRSPLLLLSLIQHYLPLGLLSRLGAPQGPRYRVLLIILFPEPTTESHTGKVFNKCDVLTTPSAQSEEVILTPPPPPQEQPFSLPSMTEATTFTPICIVRNPLRHWVGWTCAYISSRSKGAQESCSSGKWPCPVLFLLCDTVSPCWRVVSNSKQEFGLGIHQVVF